MATRAERERAETERTAAVKKTAKKQMAKKAAKPAAKEKLGHTETKATYAREPRGASGQATRKSTRGSANRAKADSSLNRHDEQVKGSPDAQHRRAAARTKRVRGSS